ncbi:MAG: YlbF family regulator [Acutalibacteraceae bacterium]|jgi:cell fate (sporulation/competence/biofilm development) regulator YlbF (YheA/YmcA/DUF963 family)
MDLIRMTRELGAALQQDRRFVAFFAATEAKNADAELTAMLEAFQTAQTVYRREAENPDISREKLDELAQEQHIFELYEKIFDNEHMQNFQRARKELDDLMKHITGILTLCALGDDPESCEPQRESGCSGSCSSCEGCD